MKYVCNMKRIIIIRIQVILRKIVLIKIYVKDKNANIKKYIKTCNMSSKCIYYA